MFKSNLPLTVFTVLAGIAHSSFVSADIYQSSKKIGYLEYPTEVAEKITTNNNWRSVEVYNTDDIKNNIDLFVINLSSQTKDLFNVAQKVLESGKVLIIDSSELMDKSLIEKLTSEVIGVGLTDPIIIAKFSNGKYTYSLTINFAW